MRVIKFQALMHKPEIKEKALTPCVILLRAIGARQHENLNIKLNSIGKTW